MKATVIFLTAALLASVSMAILAMNPGQLFQAIGALAITAGAIGALAVPCMYIEKRGTNEKS